MKPLYSTLARRWLVQGLTKIVQKIKKRERQNVTTETTPTMAEIDLFLQIDEWIRKDKAFLRYEMSVEEVAVHFCTNRSYVSRAVKSSTGLSFPEFVNRIRIDYAMAAAREDPSVRVTDMARIANYSYTATFSQAFQRYMSMRPREWLVELRSDTVSKGKKNRK